MDKLKALKGYDRARDAIEWHTSPRAKRLQLLEAIVTGTQYEGRPSWFNTDVGLFERAPCIVYPVVRIAIDSFVDLVLGDQRFATFMFESDEGELTIDEAELVTRGVEQVQRASRFRMAMRHALRSAMSTGSACLIAGAKDGKPFIEGIDAWKCTPELDRNGVVTRLVIQYPDLEEYQDQNDEWHIRAVMHRRVVDNQRDVAYKPLPIEKGVKVAGWREDPNQIFEHGLGFCPVVWYGYMRATRVAMQPDGVAIHQGLEDEIYALDVALSQRHRAALYAGDPQIVITGAEQNITLGGGSSGGRSVIATQNGGEFGDEGPPRPHYEYRDYAPKEGQIKKSPGTVWIIPTEQARVNMLTLTEKDIGAVDRNAQDIRAKLSEALSVVFIDPEEVKFASQITGKALETLRERQINRCDQIRDDVADGMLLPAVDMLLRVVTAMPGMRVGSSVKKILAILKRYMSGKTTAAAPTTGQWSLPEPRLIWGAYFKEDPDEQRIITEATINSLNAGLITRKTAIERLKTLGYIIGNVDTYIQQLDKEKNELLTFEVDKTKQLSIATAAGKPKPADGAPKKVQIK